MAKRKGPTPKRRVQAPQRRLGARSRWPWVVAAVAALGVVAAAVTFSRDGDGGGAGRRATADGDGPVHVHGLGINPADGALFIATHTGLWRAGPRETRARRVTDERQDTMGFAVAGPDYFLGSGHPDLRTDLPPLLGLIESRDGGESWTPVSLLGEADFHVLRVDGRRVYGFDVTGERLMISRDGGRTWAERVPPGGVLDLAVDPAAQRRLIATGERGLVESRDEGVTWRLLAQTRVGFLAWPARDALYLVDTAGSVAVSSDGGRTWALAGDVGGEPAAFMASGERELYVALHDGTVKRSRDGGRTWSIRVNPA